jgi:putative toxin-antitoxin system antitoxin component (TIGR02293 family)
VEIMVSSAPKTQAFASLMPSALAWSHLPLKEKLARVRQGVPAEWVRFMEAQMDLPRPRLCSIVGLKVSTINRKLKEQSLLSQEESERLMALHQLIGQVQALVNGAGETQDFDAAAWLSRWLLRPSQALGGDRPADYMDAAEGRQRIAQLLAMNESGAYA